MAKIKKDYFKNLLKAIDNEFASVAKDGIIHDNEKFINTGSFLLNAQLSGDIYKGFSCNRIVAFAGAESTYKSYMLLGIIKKYLEENEENVVWFFGSEGAITQKELISRGIDVSRVLYIPVKSIEEFKIQSLRLVREHEKTPSDERPYPFMCLDSLGMLPSIKEIEDAEAGEIKTDLTRAREIKSTFRILTPALAILNIPMIIINHTYSTMDKYNPQEMGGGSGLKFAASVIVYFSKSVVKDEDTKEIRGGIVSSRLIKSRRTKERTKIQFPVYVDTGLDEYGGLFDFCYEKGLIKKEGTKYYWYNDNKNKMFRKDILAKPEEFFTKKILDDFNVFCNNYFSVGASTPNLSDESLDDLSDEDIPEELK